MSNNNDETEFQRLDDKASGGKSKKKMGNSSCHNTYFSWCWRCSLFLF